MPLYDILNEFQNGSSHMAAVVKPKWKRTNTPPSGDGENLGETKVVLAESKSTTTLVSKKNVISETVAIDIEKVPRPIKVHRQISFKQDPTTIFSEDLEDGEVIGIITLEDVFEELLQVITHILFPFFNSLYFRLETRL